MIKKKIFLNSSDREVWYETLNLGIPIFLWLQSLHIWKIQQDVCLIFRGHIQRKRKQNKLASCLWSISDRTNASTEKIYTSFESPDTQLLSPKEKGVTYPWGAPRSHPSNLLYLLFLRSWRPCEVDEVKKQCFISNLPISFEYKCH